MLKPVSGLNNCESDSDKLLVSILETTSKACKVSGSHASSSAVHIAKSVLGDGVTDDNWASEGEEIVDVEDSNILLDSEHQVVDLLGGYVITRLARQGKLSCADCQSSLLKSEQGILVQKKQYDGCKMLKSSSSNLKDFLVVAEQTFRSKMKSKQFFVSNDIGKALQKDILGSAPALQCCHPEAAANAVITLYCRVRLHHTCKLYNQNISKKRKEKTKEKKLRKLNAIAKNKQKKADAAIKKARLVAIAKEKETSKIKRDSRK